MPPAVLDRSALDSLFSRASQWPSDGDWDRGAQDTAEHLIEHSKTGQLMVLVPAGKSLDGTCFAVDRSAYYIGVHPVTNAQHARFVAETGHRPPDNQIWQDSGTTNHPVTNVSWEDVTAYCGWAELRLPTDLEWEKAARGLNGSAYPWGMTWDSRRCRNGTNKCKKRTADVWRYGQGGAPFGGLQLSGNVWEWCANRVVRGGSWDYSNSNIFTVSHRRRPELPSIGRDYYGFRCVCGFDASP